jgi:type II secretory pathway pseudopilin PulG
MNQNESKQGTIFKKNNRESGFTILETIIVLIIMISIITTSAIWMKKSADNGLNRNAAEDLMQLTKAVQLYARDNFTTLINADETDIQFNKLIENKYISKEFSQKNSYGQEYKISISNKYEADIDNKTLQIIIITQGGDVITTANMSKIAALAGTNAGYSEQNGKIIGNQHGWYYDSPINSGHIATLSYTTSKDVVSAEGFLRRNKYDGHPEWNQMNTDLDMQGNAVSMSKDGISGLVDFNGLIFKDKQQSTLTSDKLAFTSANATDPTTLTGDYTKPATYIFDNLSDNAFYKKVDDICGSGEPSYGKIFFAGIKSGGKNYLAKFTCGPDDGYKLGAGRAYLTERLGGPIVDMTCKFIWTSRHGCNIPLTSDGRYYESVRTAFSNNTSQGWYYTEKHNGRIDAVCKNNGNPHRESTACSVTKSAKKLSTFIVSPNSSQNAAIGVPGRIENDPQCNAYGENQNLDNGSHKTIILVFRRFPPYTDEADPPRTNTFDTCQRIKVQSFDDSSIYHSAPFVNKETD